MQEEQLKNEFQEFAENQDIKMYKIEQKMQEQELRNIDLQQLVREMQEHQSLLFKKSGNKGSITKIEKLTPTGTLTSQEVQGLMSDMNKDVHALKESYNSELKGMRNRAVKTEGLLDFM